MNRHVIVAAVAFALCLQTAYGQEKKEPPEQISKLNLILGTFEGEATMVQEGKSTKGTVSHHNSKISDGWGFLIDETVTMEDGSAYKALNMIGYDAGGKKMHVFSVTNAGETHDHKGTWTNAMTISIQYDGKWEGKPYVEKASMTIDGPNAYTLSWSATLGGKTVGSGQEKLHRAKDTQ